MSNHLEAPTSVVEKAYFVEDFQGFDLLIQLGTNAQGDRIVRQQIRQTGTAQWFPFIEMMLEFDNYWRDAQSGFRNPPKDDPPPPPLDA